jgi:hypothetical protein
MTYILEVNEQGALYLPPELLGNAKPHTRYVLGVQGDTLILHPEKPQPFWVTATPQKQAEAFRKWASMERSPAPTLPLEALRRENIYE